jgi:gamma-glutamyl-gamma-aminobutyrate hydrolase PuuD
MSLPIYLSDPTGPGGRSKADHDYITKNMHDTVENLLASLGHTSVKNVVGDMVPGKVDLTGFGGVIIFGGFDIDSAFYSKSAYKKRNSYVDEYELELIRVAVESGLPVLGICRGMQLINVAFGGTLHSDIGHLTKMQHNNFGAGAYEHRALAHPVIVAGSSVLADGEYVVASSHHQSVDEVGDTLTVTSRSDDGIIEMIENAELNVIGTQWHPEAAHVVQSDTLTPLVKAFLTHVPDAPEYAEGAFVNRPAPVKTRSYTPAFRSDDGYDTFESDRPAVLDDSRYPDTGYGDGVVRSYDYYKNRYGTAYAFLDEDDLALADLVDSEDGDDEALDEFEAEIQREVARQTWV